MTKPFLLLSIRTEPLAATDEEAAFARYLGAEHDLERRLLGGEDCTDVPGLVASGRWAGVLLGGGAFTWSDPTAGKSAQQLRAERELWPVLDAVLAEEVPFLGACYGIGTLGSHQGGVVDRSHPEPVGPLSVTLTGAAADDPLLAGLPVEFAAYGGHKEALTRTPPGAVVLATSRACPVQAFRVGRCAWATQFHPELDLAGILTRIETYATYGYFDPAEVPALTAAARAVEVTHPLRVLGRFAVVATG